jgi:hypothetical protein
MIILAVAVGIPLLFHRRLKKRIKKTAILTTMEVLTGLVILFIGVGLLFYFLFSGDPYPTVTKSIGQKYYFEQTEYGMAWTHPGKHLVFYKKSKDWFDKKIGYIDWLWGTADINAYIKDDSSAYLKRLILKENDKIVLDTLLNFKYKFDFNYLAK